MMEELPAELLRHVISFLPLKEAIKTTPFLSSAWRDLWTPRIVETDLNPRTIAKFLEFRDFHELMMLSCRISNEDTKQISVAKGVERELVLDFNDRETGHYALTLHSKLPSEVASFASLRNLHLKCVGNAFVELASSLFENCELLERLKLEQCRGLERLDIVGGGRLEDVAVIDCGDVVQISISSLSLKWFEYRGPLPRMNMKNSPNVVNVTIDVDLIDENEFDCEEVLSLFSSLRNVETLRIAGWLLEWLCLAGVIFQQLDIRFNRLLQLWISEPCLNKTILDSLSSFFDICPSLEKLYIDIDCETQDSICPYFDQYWHEPYLGFDFSILKATSTSWLKRLRVVEVSGFDVNEYGLRLLDLLLKRALLLSSMKVKFHNGFLGRVVKLPLSQLSNARTNEELMSVLSPNKDYYLVFTYV